MDPEINGYNSRKLVVNDHIHVADDDKAPYPATCIYGRYITDVIWSMRAMENADVRPYPSNRTRHREYRYMIQVNWATHEMTALKPHTVQPFLVAVLDFAVLVCRRYGLVFCRRLGMSPF